MTDKATMAGDADSLCLRQWSRIMRYQADADRMNNIADKYDSLAAVAGRMADALEKQAKVSDLYLDETGEAINAYNALMKGR